MAKTVLVTGASGFIGSHLASALVEAGHDVRAMTRPPGRVRRGRQPVAGDVADPASLDARPGRRGRRLLPGALARLRRLRGRRTPQAARNFAAAGARAGLERIVYLGGLGADDGELSAHLRSRRTVEQLLRAGRYRSRRCGRRS